jgi:dienelactone hydrolase
VTVFPHEGEYPVLYSSYGIPAGSSYRTGFVTRPDRSGQFPGVLVIPPPAGVTSHVKTLSWMLARRGFAVVAIDPYRGPADDPPARYSATSDRTVLKDLGDAISFVLSEDTDWFIPERVGLWGIDVGGRFAVLRAVSDPHVGAVAVSYTPLKGDDDRGRSVGEVLERLVVPVLGLYGKDDPRIPVADVDEAQTVNAAGQWIVYEGVGHDFLDEDSDGYHGGAAGDAVARVTRLFETYLPRARQTVTS